MHEFLIRYYMSTENGRILRFEKKAKFGSTPNVGNQLELKGDNLHVEHVIFVEEGPVVLVVKSESISDSEVEDIIEDMTIDTGWELASDTGNR